MKETFKKLGKKKITALAAGVIVITALLIGGLVFCGTDSTTEGVEPKASATASASAEPSASPKADDKDEDKDAEASASAKPSASPEDADKDDDKTSSKDSNDKDDNKSSTSSKATTTPKPTAKPSSGSSSSSSFSNSSRPTATATPRPTATPEPEKVWVVDVPAQLEQGHWEEVGHWTSDWVYQCNGCGAQFDTAEAAGNHNLSEAMNGNMNCGGYTMVSGEPYWVKNGEVWVVDVPAQPEQGHWEYIY